MAQYAGAVAPCALNQFDLTRSLTAARISDKQTIRNLRLTSCGLFRFKPAAARQTGFFHVVFVEDGRERPDVCRSRA
jgi:hypothetical protein